MGVDVGVDRCEVHDRDLIAVVADGKKIFFKKISILKKNKKK